MERNEAREHFKNLGLSYDILTNEDIAVLQDILSAELSSYRLHGGDHARLMDMKVSKPRLKDVKVLKTGLKHALLQIDGSYFSRREGITFSQTGFIGFGGEFDDAKWCDYVAEKTKAA